MHKLNKLLKSDFEHFHASDYHMASGFDSHSSNYPANMEHPIKHGKIYQATTLNYLIDHRTEKERANKHYYIRQYAEDMNASALTEAVATLARSGPAASDIKVLIDTKGIQNINFEGMVFLPYLESYTVSHTHTNWKGDIDVEYEVKWRVVKRHFHIMELAAMENNTLFFETVFAEYCKAMYANKLNISQKNSIERALLSFLNHSNAHRHCIGNSLYGAHQRAIADLQDRDDFNPEQFNHTTKAITHELCIKLYEHVENKRLKPKTAWILSFTVCLLLPLISHIIVWCAYFYQKHKMDFQSITISKNRYLDYLNRKGDNFIGKDIEDHLDQKAAAKKVPTSNHGCSYKATCEKISHRYRIPKQVTVDGDKVHITSTFWNGQTKKFKNALKALGKEIDPIFLEAPSEVFTEGASAPAQELDSVEAKYYAPPVPSAPELSEEAFAM